MNDPYVGWAHLAVGQAKKAHYFEPDGRTACRSYGSIDGPPLAVVPVRNGFNPTARSACAICKRQRLVAARG